MKQLMIAAVIAIFIAPTFASANDRNSATNVVQIRCSTVSGEMKATGFVWPKPGFVVTALHAVAGCKEVVVYSEAKRDETIATGVERAYLKADLALLKLRDDMGLKPVPFVKNEPDMRADHFVWGYPHAAEEMIDAPINFAGGLQGVTTLGEAFSSTDLNKLFATQEYPSRNTQIIRVTSTIQPGHSGAPIFNKSGQVAAIADGGLLGGWKGINWSIPAHIYLPGLLDSKDPLPKSASSWSGLYSAVTTASLQKVKIATGEKSVGTMHHVRRVPLSLIEAELKKEDKTWGADLRELKQILGATAYQRLAFDIYEESTTDVTIGVPTGVGLSWNKPLNAIVAEDDRGDLILRMTTAVYKAKNHQSAKAFGEQQFAKTLAKVADFDTDVSRIPYESDKPGFSYFDGEAEGTDIQTWLYADISVYMDVWENVFLGSALYIIGEEEDYDDEDYAMKLMFDIASLHLTDFALK